MRRKQTFHHLIGPFLVLLVVIVAADLLIDQAGAASLVCPASKDNTLFQWDPASGDPIHSNGQGNFFSAGRIRPDGQIQRGLIQFDLAGIPAEAIIDSATLDLYVISVPNRDQGHTRSFWLEPLWGIEEPSWGEGNSVSNITPHGGGGGGGAPAQPGDATWLHKQYDTAFWPDGDQGALGEAPLDYPVALAVGSVPGDIDPVVEPALVSWTSDQMIADVQAWVDDPNDNFGWVVVGEEVFDPGGNTSSKRSFASREHADTSLWPRLRVEYLAIPEPSTWVMGLAVLLALGLMRSRWRP